MHRCPTSVQLKSGIEPLSLRDGGIIIGTYARNPLMRKSWLLSTFICGLGLLYVTALPSDAQSEMVQTIVEIVHSFPKAKDGELY